MKQSIQSFRYPSFSIHDNGIEANAYNWIFLSVFVTKSSAAFVAKLKRTLRLSVKSDKHPNLKGRLSFEMVWSWSHPIRIRMSKDETDYWRLLEFRVVWFCWLKSLIPRWSIFCASQRRTTFNTKLENTAMAFFWSMINPFQSAHKLFTFGHRVIIIKYMGTPKKLYSFCNVLLPVPQHVIITYKNILESLHLLLKSTLWSMLFSISTQILYWLWYPSNQCSLFAFWKTSLVKVADWLIFSY